MKDTPEISVVMSVYNGMPFLPLAIESILNQSFQDFEFIIIEDCSTDESKNIINEYGKKDKRIKAIYNQVNKGQIALGINMANGVIIAKGKYIARMDSDDIADTLRFEKQLNHFYENPDIDIVGTWVININDKGVEIGYRKYPTDSKLISKLIWTCPVVHPTVMFKRESILRVGNYSDKSGRRDDYELWFRCEAAGLKFSNLPYFGLKYRFFDEFYQKNDLKVAWKQMVIGLKGCVLVNAPLQAYLGVTAPVIRSIFPKKFNAFLHKKMNNVDPRKYKE
jgi:glycosyltransferase EpsE